MQPLKRFTQCGSLTMLFAVFIVLFGVSSTALTTFGKSNQNPPQPTPPQIKGRECNSHIDCQSLQQTSCVPDLYDEKLRCLCGDNNAPNNGYCSTKLKGLRHTCVSDECNEGMLCTVDNSTRTTALGSRSNNAQKVCLCDEELGYVEKKHGCSAAEQLFTGVLMPITALIMGLLMAKKPTH